MSYDSNQRRHPWGSSSSSSSSSKCLETDEDDEEGERNSRDQRHIFSALTLDFRAALG